MHQNLKREKTMDVSQRLFRLMRTITEDKFESISRLIETSSERFDERLRNWEAEFGIGADENPTDNSWQHQYQNEDTRQHQESGADAQLREDLELFGLTPPSSLEEVRQIRNRELKKFHPDKYTGEPEKLETAKQIVQIYNTAFDRLKQHYQRNA